MKPSEFSLTLKSFKQLKTLLEKEAFPFHTSRSPDRQCREDKVEKPETEEQIFKDAMADVTPLPGKLKAEIEPKTRLPVELEENPDSETLMQLENLVKHGKGFVVAQTSEYIEGTGYHAHPEITKRLHRGDFSIQAHIDLHGLTAERARETFEAFLKTSIQKGMRAVLIVHGRGLSSPSEPILKTKVYEWLTCGFWRRWIIAFSSARSCDGGAGATYVLLRNRPLTKRFRKKTTTCLQK
jgi:DNA-nicking Smr family endonuclease